LEIGGSTVLRLQARYNCFVVMCCSARFKWIEVLSVATTNKNDARLQLRLAADLKREIEEAAAHLGQSVSEFAISTLVQVARDVNEQQKITKLTNRDRDIFLAMLDDVDREPNKALIEAAEFYKRHMSKQQMP
jgi:uncharacterized protein (DUF1778 family)